VIKEKSLLFAIFISCCFSLFFYSISLAEDTNFTINAATLEYSQDGSKLSAIGKVEVSYKDIKAYGESFTYYLKDSRLFTGEKFKLDYQGISIFGKGLDINMQTKTGEASDVSILYDGVYISGKHIKLTPQKIDFLSASFTTCDEREKHYYVSASEIILDTNDGWIIANWGIFYLFNIPSMIVPIYIYDAQAPERGTINKMPYPQVGSNNDDGFFISQSIPWYKNQSLKGDFSLSYSEKKSFGAGFGLNYKIDSNNEGFFDVSAKVKDHIRGAFNHYTYFGPEVKNKEDMFKFDILKKSKQKQYMLETKVSMNEKINYETVSMLPNLKIEMKKNSIGNIDIDGNISGGNIAEESSGVSAFKMGGEVGGTTTLWENSTTKFKPGLSVGGFLYTQGSHRAKTSFDLGFYSKWSSNFSSKFIYSHYLTYSGGSPYNFENYNFSVSDKLISGIIYRGEKIQFGVDSIYNLTNILPEELDYIFGFNFHCFAIILKYRATRQEFNFNLEFS